MNCPNMQNKLFDFSDGTLADDEHAMVAQHIDRCDSCKAIVAKLRDAHAMIGTERTLMPSPGFTSLVMNEITNAKQFAPASKMGLLQLQNWVAAASVAVCIWAGYATGNWYSTSIDAVLTNEIYWFDDTSMEMMDVIYNE